MVVWVLTTSNSSGVRGPGLRSSVSGTPIFPTSWNIPAAAMRRHSRRVKEYLSVRSMRRYKSRSVTSCMCRPCSMPSPLR